MKTQTTDKNSGNLKINCLPRLFLTFTFVFLIFGSVGLTSIFAQAGRLDPAFGNAGKVLGFTLNRTSNSIAIQADGKILVAGQNNSKFSVFRFNADGSVDNTFGSSGVAQTHFYLCCQSAASAVAVQADGKIVAVGQTGVPNGSVVNQTDFAIARFLPTGALDTTFGINGGIVTPGSSIDDLTEVVIQTDGKILATGVMAVRAGANNYVGTSIFALRYTHWGALDTDFSGDGIAGISFDIPTNPIQGNQLPRSLVLQPDGKIVVGGSISIPNFSGNTAVARFLPNGQPDAAFGTGGKLSLNSNGAYSMALQPDGKLILVGNGFGVARLLPDGSFDNTFGTDGQVIPPIGAGLVQATSVKIQPNGKIVVAGYSGALDNSPTPRVTYNFALTRYNPDGSLDVSFGDGGKVITDFGNYANDYINGIALLADGKILAGGTSNNQIALARYFAEGVNRGSPFDFDGDGRADIAVYRPGNSAWYILYSSNIPIFSNGYGQLGDLPAPADYDGDGATDVAVFRPTGTGDPNKAYFYIPLNGNPFYGEQFGRQGDVPVPGDWDGDGRADLAVYRDGSQTGGQSYFFYRPSSQPGADFSAIAWGAAGDKPVIGDYDGDGKLDAAVFRPSIAYWYVLRSSDNQFEYRQFGVSTDIPTPADFDGDGTTNFSVYRPSTGSWYTSIDPATNYGEVRWGISTDIPIPADYDGDGRADIAVFRPETGSWYVLRSTAGYTSTNWGANGDKPVPNIFVP